MPRVKTFDEFWFKTQPNDYDADYVAMYSEDGQCSYFGMMQRLSNNIQDAIVPQLSHTYTYICRGVVVGKIGKTSLLP